mgnify:CR=1 FL=1
MDPDDRVIMESQCIRTTILKFHLSIYKDHFSSDQVVVLKRCFTVQY